jgi:hypothetical protein
VVRRLNVARTPLDVHNARDKEQHVCYHQRSDALSADLLGFTDLSAISPGEDAILFRLRVKDSWNGISVEN